MRARFEKEFPERWHYLESFDVDLHGSGKFLTTHNGGRLRIMPPLSEKRILGRKWVDKTMSDEYSCYTWAHIVIWYMIWNPERKRPKGLDALHEGEARGPNDSDDSNGVQDKGNEGRDESDEEREENGDPWSIYSREVQRVTIEGGTKPRASP